MNKSKNKSQSLVRRIDKTTPSGRLAFLLGSLFATMTAVGGVTATRLFELLNLNDCYALFGSIAILLILFFISLCIKDSLSESLLKWGTAYYLGLLVTGMRDEHRSSFKKLMNENDFQDYRALTGNLPLSTSVGHDWTAEISSMVTRTQESVNQDDISTGFIIVPNFLFPAALSFGSQVYFPHDVELIEIPKSPFSSDGKELAVKDWPRWELPDLDNQVVKLKESKVPDLEDNTVLDASDTMISPEMQKLFSVEIEKRSNAGITLVTLQNTVLSGGKLDLSGTVQFKYRFSLFPNQTPTHNKPDILITGSTKCPAIDQINIISDDDKNSTLHETYPEIVKDNHGKEKEQIHVNLRAQELFYTCLSVLLAAEQLRATELEKLKTAENLYPSSTDMPPLVLCARLPKTIVVALGQVIDLINVGERQRDSIWKNLILLNWENYKVGWRIVRVHPAQLPLEEQLKNLRQYGYKAPNTLS